jgi:suppressor of G2 allele of SKP1
MAERKHVVYRNNKGDDGPPPVDKNTQAAEKHLENNQFEDVVKSAQKALDADPMRLRPYLQLAIAHQRLGQHEEALEAAESGICVADKKHDKASLATAQLRRAIALFQLGRAADAARALEWAKEDECKDKSIGIWQIKINQKKDQSTETDGFERVPMDKMPQERPVARPAKKAAPAPDPSPKIQELGDDDDEDIRQALKEKEQYKASIAAQAKKSQDFDANHIRNDFFQNNTSVNVSLFLKNVPMDSANVDFSATEAVLTCRQPTSGEPFKYTLGPFTRQIKPEESSFRVFGTKVELTLVKATSEKWPGLVAAKEEPAKPSEPKKDVSLDEMRDALNEPKLPPVNGAKNWDKLAEAELEGEDGEGEGDNPNAFFEKLYANADEDTRRAMMKSYIESNGTSLSTDWDSVKKGKVETVPPEGMEVKSWRNS